MARLRFGRYTLDPERATLFCGRQRVAIQAQPARLLAMLVERAGELVTREEIRARLWPATSVAYDQSINYCIRQIRIALGANAGQLETVPRQGYRFNAVESTTDARSMRTSRHVAAAAAILMIFASGFSAGILARHAPMGQFVYVHLVHPDRCPYMRFLFAPHHNS